MLSQFASSDPTPPGGPPRKKGTDIIRRALHRCDVSEQTAKRKNENRSEVSSTAGVVESAELAVANNAVQVPRVLDKIHT